MPWPCKRQRSTRGALAHLDIYRVLVDFEEAVSRQGLRKLRPSAAHELGPRTLHGLRGLEQAAVRGLASRHPQAVLGP